MRDIGLVPNIATFTALVDGAARAGRIDDALALMDDMRQNGVAPNTATYTCVIDGCGRAARLELWLRLRSWQLPRRPVASPRSQL